MLILVKASGNPAYPQPSPQVLMVSTTSTATGLAIARLWAATRATMVASTNTITTEVVVADNSEDGNVHAHRQ